MHRTVSDQITALRQRLTDGCLGDAEFCELQAHLEDLANPWGACEAGDVPYKDEPAF